MVRRVIIALTEIRPSVVGDDNALCRDIVDPLAIVGVFLITDDVAGEPVERNLGLV